MYATEFNELLKQAKYSSVALEKLYNAYYKHIRLHVICKFGGWIDAEEVANQVFLHIFKTTPESYVENPLVWIYNLTDKYVTDHYDLKADGELPAETGKNLFRVKQFIGPDIQDKLKDLDEVCKQYNTNLKAFNPAERIEQVPEVKSEEKDPLLQEEKPMPTTTEDIA